jgi:hypothetical protein
VFELPGGALVALLAESVGQRLVVREDHDVLSFQHVPEVLHGLIDSQQLSVTGAVLLLRHFHFFEKNARGCQVFCVRCCKTVPMAVVEASVIRAMGAAPSG